MKHHLQSQMEHMEVHSSLLLDSMEFMLLSEHSSLR